VEKGQPYIKATNGFHRERGPKTRIWWGGELRTGIQKKALATKSRGGSSKIKKKKRKQSWKLKTTFTKASLPRITESQGASFGHRPKETLGGGGGARKRSEFTVKGGEDIVPNPAWRLQKETPKLEKPKSEQVKTGFIVKENRKKKRQPSSTEPSSERVGST